MLVTGSYPPMFCGVGDYSARLAAALREEGADVHVLTTRRPEHSAENAAWVHEEMPSWTQGSIREFYTALCRINPDIVHVQYPTQGYHYATAPALLLLMARIRRNFSVVSTWHEYPSDNLTKGKICQIVLALISRAVVVVRPEYQLRVRGVLSKALGDIKIHFIPNASVIPTVALDEAERLNIRRQICQTDRPLVTFFGFAYPHKGVEQIFDITDPAKHHLLLIGDLTKSDPYHERLRSLAGSDRWRGHVTITGFVDQQLAARYLAASDAVVFPFVNGGGHWNSSLHAAMAQGTFVITTSETHKGYNPAENVYYSAPNSTAEMSAALRTHIGTRTAPSELSANPWAVIAQSHLDLYRLCQRGTGLR
jgi:glycosyltransferase involved in cell wall biosynthesis